MYALLPLNCNIDNTNQCTEVCVVTGVFLY